MINGLYQAHYASNFAPGLSAVLKLQDGKVTGCDAGYNFDGHYSVNGTRIDCTVIGVKSFAD